MFWHEKLASLSEQLWQYLHFRQYLQLRYKMPAQSVPQRGRKSWPLQVWFLRNCVVIKKKNEGLGTETKKMEYGHSSLVSRVTSLVALHTPTTLALVLVSTKLASGRPTEYSCWTYSKACYCIVFAARAEPWELWRGKACYVFTSFFFIFFFFFSQYSRAGSKPMATTAFDLSMGQLNLSWS